MVPRNGAVRAEIAVHAEAPDLILDSIAQLLSSLAQRQIQEIDMCYLRYDEPLKECGLTTLETRRLRGDQTEGFKILNGYENIDSNIFQN